jgi:hypothetical protein
MDLFRVSGTLSDTVRARGRHSGLIGSERRPRNEDLSPLRHRDLLGMQAALMGLLR